VGESWTDIATPDGLNFLDVRRDGDRLVSVSNSAIGWSEDDGFTWSSWDLPTNSYSTTVRGGRIGYIDVGSETWENPIYVKDLSTDAAPERLPPLPDQPVLDMMELRDGTLLASTPAGLLRYEDDISWWGLGYFRLANISLGQDEDIEGVWSNHQNYSAPPMFFSRDTNWNGDDRRWPRMSDEPSAAFRTATGLAMYDEGAYACTGGDLEDHGAGLIPVGSGVYEGRTLGYGWDEVGTGYPDSPHTSEAKASCSALWNVGGRLFASTDAGMIGLDGAGSWQPVEGIVDPTGIVQNSEGWWALTPDGLSLSEDGWSFGLTVPAAAGATHLLVHDDQPTVLLDGVALVGMDETPLFIDGTDGESLLSIHVQDGVLRGVTASHTMVVLTDD
jgi:hypothetical protein